jgi:hypothetical protein
MKRGGEQKKREEENSKETKGELKERERNTLNKGRS